MNSARFSALSGSHRALLVPLLAPALKAIAPTLTELPFTLAQIAALALFVVLAIVAAVKFRHEAAAEMTHQLEFKRCVLLRARFQFIRISRL